MARLLNNPSIETALWAPAPAPWFEEGKRREKLISEASELEAFAGNAPAGWLESWQRAGRPRPPHAIQQRIESSGGLNGPLVAQEVWGMAKGNLVFGSSNVIRDADLCGTPADKSAAHVYANRGLAGIDGTIATATGIAQTRAGLKTTVLLGDVTFLHDVGGLLLGLGEPEPEMDVVVLNDGGGAIFSTLEHGAVEESGRYADAVETALRHPAQGADRIPGCGLRLGVPRRGRAWTGFAGSLGSTGAPRRLIEVVVGRNGLRALHAGIAEAVNALEWPEEPVDAKWPRPAARHVHAGTGRGMLTAGFLIAVPGARNPHRGWVSAGFVGRLPRVPSSSRITTRFFPGWMTGAGT